MNPSMEVQSLIDHANLSSYIDNSQILNYTERWPLIVHFLCTVFCLGSSAIYHQFNLKNKDVQMMLARLDYGGICLQICGSTYPVIVYTFSCNQVAYIRYSFLILSTMASLSCFVVLMIPRFGDSGYQKFRGNLFISLGIASAFPFLYLGFNT